ncbi:DNA-directed RNA polymerase [Yersinia enterocolitica]
MDFNNKIYTESDFSEYYNVMIDLFGEELATRELHLELESYNLGSERYIKRLNASVEREEITNDVSVKPIIQVLIPLVADYMKHWLNTESEKKPRRSAQYPILLKLNPDLVAFIGIKLTLSKLIKNEMVTVQHCGSAIGRALEEELRFGRLREFEEDYLTRIVQGTNKRVGTNYKRIYLTSTEQHIIDQNNEVENWQRWSNAAAINLGVKVLDFIISSTGLFERELVTVKGKTHAELKIAPAFKQKIAGRAYALSSISPIYQPMIIPPKPWTDLHNGGYYSKGRNPLSFIRINNQQALSRYEDVDLERVFNAVNIAQDTPWKINEKVLEVVEQIYQWDFPVADIPAANEIELPARYQGMDEDTPTGRTLLKKWKKECVPVYRKEKGRVSKRLATEFIVNQAKKFRNERAIYFPHNLDFRGRIYAVPLFNPQGNDLTKSLLTFANGKPIGERGFYWLKIHGANTAGIDKLSFDGRIKWIHQNENLIISCATDPLNNLEWADMDQPLMFLAFCFEYYQVKIHGLTYVSSLPVSFDGSNSGAQHFSAMLRDENGATAVNLQPSDKPHDIYQIIADNVNTVLQNDLLNGTENKVKVKNNTDGSVYEQTVYGTKELARQWLQFGVSRKVCKRPTMTVVYSATKYGFSDQIMQDTVRPAIDDGTGYMFLEPRQNCQYLANLIWAACQETITSAMHIMEWLKEAAKLLAKEVVINGVVVKKTLPVFWITPDNFPVWQCYFKQKKVSISSLILGRTTRLKVSEDDSSGAINAAKQATGVAPNFVHSMDATHLRMTVNHANSKYGITSFALIHDSFGTVAADADNLFKSIREAFVDMYEHNDVIQEFYYQFENQLHETQLQEMPAIPTKGNFEIREVLNSKYCFA